MSLNKMESNAHFRQHFTMFPAAIILGFLLLGCGEARSLTEDRVAAELNEDLAVEFTIFISILSNRFVG